MSGRNSTLVSHPTSRSSPILPGVSLRNHALRQPLGPLSSRFNSARFNSTSTTTQTSELSQFHTPTPNNAVESIDSISDKDLADVDISQIPEQWGYLKQLGLDFGFGPSTTVEWLLEWIHISTGLPWVTSALVAGVVVRLGLFFLSAGASDNQVKMQNLKHVTEPLRERMRHCQKEGDQLGMIKASQELRIVHAEHGVKPFKAFWPLIQVPIGFGFFRVLRGMSNLPVPGLESESFLWLKDLTLNDPYFILPVTTGLLMHITMRRGGEIGTTNEVSKIMKPLFLYVFPCITTVVMLKWAGLMQVYFCALAVLSAIQTFFLTTPWFRSLLRIAALPPKDASSAAPPSRVRLIPEENSRINQIVPGDEQPQQAQKVSFIDRSLDKVKSGISDWKKKATGSVTEWQERKEKKHARLSKNELQRAKTYEARRKEEEEYERNMRNERAREEFLKRQEQPRRKRKDVE